MDYIISEPKVGEIYNDPFDPTKIHIPISVVATPIIEHINLNFYIDPYTDEDYELP
jgi:hypothetical protein